MRLDVSVDISAALRQLDITQRAVRDAAVDALNRSAEQARTASVRDITSTFNLQAGFVREAIEVRKATYRGDTLESALVVRGKNRSFNLIRFAERRVSLAEGRRRTKTGTHGVYVRVKRREPLQRVEGAFIGNAGRTVFRRIGKGRLPIEPLQSIGVGQAMISEIGQRVLRDTVERVFPVNLARQLKRRGVLS